MGTVLDAYGLLALFDEEPAAPDVERLLARGDVAMSTVNLAEAAERKVRLSTVTIGEFRDVVGTLPLSLIPYSETHAWRAADLRARYYHRQHSALSLADCCLVAVATPADRVATADPAVLRMATAEGIGTIELPPA